jgi:dTDP-4-dehydrorhamnose reductase
MKILLTGKNGQVGFELQRALASLGEVVPLERSGCDLANPDSIRTAIREHSPTIIVNPAAYTAVDKAESERDLAFAINGVAPGIIGEEAKKLGALVVHYSTDYVFDGSKSGAYTEEDATAPLSVYGESKLVGEEALRSSGAEHLIFRTSWVYGVHGANFLKTMLRPMTEKEELNIVSDQFGAPTSASLIADVTAQILNRVGSIPERPLEKLGLYHLTASGETSWHGYASHICRVAHGFGVSLRVMPGSIHPIPASEYPVPASRPMNSRLDCRRLETVFGFRLPRWEESVNHSLQLISELSNHGQINQNKNP